METGIRNGDILAHVNMLTRLCKRLSFLAKVEKLIKFKMLRCYESGGYFPTCKDVISVIRPQIKPIKKRRNLLQPSFDFEKKLHELSTTKEGGG